MMYAAVIYASLSIGVCVGILIASICMTAKG
jgi:hypothetical protein